MKFRIIILFLLVSATLAPALTTQEREVVTQMRDTITELRGKLTAAESANDAALGSLTIAATQTAELIAQSIKAADDAARLAAERDQLSGDLAIQKVKMDKLNAKYQFAQFLVAITIALLAGVLTFYLTMGLQPPYNFLIPIGVAAAAYGIVVSIL